VKAERRVVWFALPLVAAVATTRYAEANRTNDSGVALRTRRRRALAFHISPESAISSPTAAPVLAGALSDRDRRSQINASARDQQQDACQGRCLPSSIYALRVARLTWFKANPRKSRPSFAGCGSSQIRTGQPPEQDPANPSKPYLLGCPSSGCVDTVVGGPVLFGPGGASPWS